MKTLRARNEDRLVYYLQFIFFAVNVAHKMFKLNATQCMLVKCKMLCAKYLYVSEKMKSMWGWPKYLTANKRLKRIESIKMSLLHLNLPSSSLFWFISSQNACWKFSMESSSSSWIEIKSFHFISFIFYALSTHFAFIRSTSPELCLHFNFMHVIAFNWINILKYVKRKHFNPFSKIRKTLSPWCMEFCYVAISYVSWIVSSSPNWARWANECSTIQFKCNVFGAILVIWLSIETKYSISVSMYTQTLEDWKYFYCVWIKRWWIIYNWRFWVQKFKFKNVFNT